MSTVAAADNEDDDGEDGDGGIRPRRFLFAVISGVIAIAVFSSVIVVD